MSLSTTNATAKFNVLYGVATAPVTKLLNYSDIPVNVESYNDNERNVCSVTLFVDPSDEESTLKVINVAVAKIEGLYKDCHDYASTK